MEMLVVLDQTRPDIGLRVAKVIVPGMRHMWKRLAYTDHNGNFTTWRSDYLAEQQIVNF